MLELTLEDKNSRDSHNQESECCYNLRGNRESIHQSPQHDPKHQVRYERVCDHLLCSTKGNQVNF